MLCTARCDDHCPMPAMHKTYKRPPLFIFNCSPHPSFISSATLLTNQANSDMVTTTPLLALLTALPFLVSAASPHGASDNGPAVVDYLPRTPPHLHPDARRSRIRRAKKQCRPKSIPKKSNHSSGAEGGAAPASSTVAGPSASTPPTSEPVPSPQAGSPPNTSSPPSDAKPGSNPPQADAAGGSGGRSGLLQASG